MGTHKTIRHRTLPVVSLFTGAGGLDLGLSGLGYHSAVCVDNDLDSLRTLRANPEFSQSTLLQADIRDLTGESLLAAADLDKNEVGLLIGGPPCQSFSKAGYWTSTGDEARRRAAKRGGDSEASDSRTPETSRRQGRVRDVGQDPRTNLVAEYARLLREICPVGFVFENVVSITHPSSRTFFERFLEECRSAGYSITVTKANAAEFGVPQTRQRVFVVGLRGHVAPNRPVPTNFVKTEHQRPELKRATTAGEAIAHLDIPSLAEPSEVVAGRWADHLAEIPPGWNYKALTEWAGHSSPSFVAETRYWHFLLKLHPDKPSWTIAANPGPWVGPFHWTSRRLRVPELAALQTFPKEFVFIGDKRSVRRQIGNAVPPLLGQKVIETVLAPIVGESREREDLVAD